MRKILLAMILTLPAPAASAQTRQQQTVPPEVYTDQGGHHDAGVPVRVEGTQDRRRYERDRRSAIRWCKQHHGHWSEGHCSIGYGGDGDRH